jgi:Xaa-Pro aminopeptidase
MNEKDRRLHAWCQERGLRGVYLRRRANVAWLAGADVHVDSGSPLGVASIRWSPKERTVLTDTIESARLVEEEFGREWRIDGRGWWEQKPEPPEGFGTDWPDDQIAPLRWSLTPPEIETARALGGETAAEMARYLKDEVRPGMTEHEVGGGFARVLLGRGIAPRVLLVAADERIERFRHPIPTAKKLERTLMLVVCAERKGLIVALTRLVHFGTLPPELRRRHDATCAVDAALHAVTRPGRRFCDLLQEAIKVYAVHGFPEEWKLHHQGGPMGYEPRDFLATPAEERRVVQNQLVGWNPTITGTKSEDTILSTGEVLTRMRDWPDRGTRPDILVRHEP